MQSVTSNAVYNAIGVSESVMSAPALEVIGIRNNTGVYLAFDFSGYASFKTIDYLSTILFTVPEGWRPSIDPTRCIVMIDTTTDRITAGLDIHSNGSASVYFHGHTPLYGQSVVVSGFYNDILLFIG